MANRVLITDAEAFELRGCFVRGDALDDTLCAKIANSDQVAVIVGRASSSIRRWGTKEDSPLYGLLEKTYPGPRAPWVCSLSALWDKRQKIIGYKSGPRT